MNYSCSIPRGKVWVHLCTKLLRQRQVDCYQTFPIISFVAATCHDHHHFWKQAYSEQRDNGSLLTSHISHLYQWQLPCCHREVERNFVPTFPKHLQTDCHITFKALRCRAAECTESSAFSNSLQPRKECVRRKSLGQTLPANLPRTGTVRHPTFRGPGTLNYDIERRKGQI